MALSGRPPTTHAANAPAQQGACGVVHLLPRAAPADLGVQPAGVQQGDEVGKVRAKRGPDDEGLDPRAAGMVAHLLEVDDGRLQRSHADAQDGPA
jgi:hypothetical protein